MHEAFAEPISYDPEPGEFVEKEPPEAIEELPPETQPEGDNIVWIPGYWNWDEDRCTIRPGHGPENITALRRFAVGAITSKSRDTVAAMIQRLARNVRLVFGYLRMTHNSRPRPRPL